jgi:hypothetical protein
MIMGRNGRYLAKTAHDHEVARMQAAGLALCLEPLMSLRARIIFCVWWC